LGTLLVMDGQRTGAAIRLVRMRRRWRQSDVAAASGVSSSTVSRIERGHVGSLSIDTVAAVAASLDIRLDLLPRWRSGDLDRLLNARHAALHESVARSFRELREWVVRPEVSFAVYGERGVIDLLAWHSTRRALLVIELKTDIVDVNDLLGTVDRKRRLARKVAAELGWQAGSVSAWVIVASGRTNRRRIAAHGAVLRNAFPMDGRGIGGWIREPEGAVAALSTWPDLHGQSVRPDLATVRRVRRPPGSSA
jgi:transcriptional regulator with XRE-family HTH domain